MARASVLSLVLLGAFAGTAARAQGTERDTTRRDAAGSPPWANPTLHRDTLDIYRPQPFVLRPFVQPGSERVVVDGVRLDSSQYRLDARRGRLWLEIRPPSGESRLTVHYRTFPFDFRDVYRRRGVADTTTGGAVAIREEAEASSERLAGDGPGAFENVSLERSGSVSRGVIAGSNRDAAVESGLRFQLSGDVSENVGVQAVLTDENTPLQPEGTTQRLDDFDRVFVQLDAPQGTARLGDVDLTLDGTTFARFQRKIQGAAVETGYGRGFGEAVPAFETRALGGGDVTVAGATARGQYRLQQIEPRDGVQGPYQLRADTGEEFIIVIAGSEEVYLDGERLTRGAAEDYIIDYARAQVTFTAENLVTDDRRIRVEFEYRTSSYSRTLVAGQGAAGFWRRAAGAGEQAGEARLEVGATFIRESDSRSFGGAAGLTVGDSAALARAGDGEAIGNGGVRVPFDPEAPFVAYRRVATSPGSAVDSVFEALDAAPPEGAPVWRVRFSRVGDGQGSYARAGRRNGLGGPGATDNALNGIVYEYRGPGGGAYAPRRELPRPTQQRLFDLHGRLEPLDGLTVFGEWARSVNDQNRFSPLDAADDRDRAYHTGVRLAPLGVALGGSALGTVSGEVERRFRGRHFASFVRTRPVEFGRKWNLPSDRVTGTGGVRGAGDETVDEGELRLGILDGSTVHVGVGRLTLGEAFRGFRRAGGVQIQEAGWPRLDYRAALVTSRDRLGAVPFGDRPPEDNRPGEEPPGEDLPLASGAEIDGRWLRQRGALWQPLLGGDLTPRLEVEHERRQQRVASAGDSLSGRSFSFVEVRPSASFRTSDALRAGAEVEFRTEQEALAGALRDAATAVTVQTNAAYEPSDVLDVTGRLGYRRRRFTDAFRGRDGRRGTSSLIGRVEGRWRPLDRAVEVRGFYRAQTERTPVLEELYVRAGPERGQYVWEDANGDGLRQTDEFLPERTPNEGAYVQRYVPSDSLRPVASVEGRVRVDLAPARQWRGADVGWQRWLSEVETQTTLEVREESRSDALARIYLLDQSAFRRAGSTQRGRLRLAQRVRLFPNTSRYGLDVGASRVDALSDLAAGAEETFLTQWEVEGRVRPGRRWSVRLSGLLGQNRAESEAYASRRYDIDRIQVEPQATFRPFETLRFTASGVFAQKSDSGAGGRSSATGSTDGEAEDRRAQVLRLPLEVEWSRARRLRLTVRGEASRVTLTGGDARGLARYELTDGRGAGTSFRWGLGGRYAVNEYLSASLTYDGRAPSEAPVVHTARVNLSASF